MPSVDVSVHAEGFQNLDRRAVSVPASGIALNLVLDSGWALSGHVAAADGTPVTTQRSAIEAVSHPAPSSTSSWGASVSAGQFHIENLPPGDYEVSFRDPEWAPPVRSPVTLRDAPIENLVLEIGPGRTITGRVLGLNGLPAARASVDWSRTSGPMEWVSRMKGSRRTPRAASGSEHPLTRSFSSCAHRAAKR